jgi:hypothetical protein
MLTRSIQKPLQIQGSRVHRKTAVNICGPLRPQTIPVELDTVSIRVTQIKSLTHPMIGRSIKRHSSTSQPSQSVS